jgi:hypothetical protein
VKCEQFVVEFGHFTGLIKRFLINWFFLTAVPLSSNNYVSHTLTDTRV